MTDAVKERPIRFSGEMVRAIIEGRKTQTRRVIKQVREQHGFFGIENGVALFKGWGNIPVNVPYEVGDRLWVRESFQTCPQGIEYKADYNGGSYEWRQSIHMPRWASRITLEITGVRAERLQDISEEDAKAEGVWERAQIGIENCEELGVAVPARPHVLAFRTLWDSLAKTGAKWADSPWVWVIEFRMVENA